MTSFDSKKQHGSIHDFPFLIFIILALSVVACLFMVFSHIRTNILMDQEIETVLDIRHQLANSGQSPVSLPQKTTQWGSPIGNASASHGNIRTTYLAYSQVPPQYCIYFVFRLMPYSNSIKMGSLSPSEISNQQELITKNGKINPHVLQKGCEKNTGMLVSLRP